MWPTNSETYVTPSRNTPPLETLPPPSHSSSASYRRRRYPPPPPPPLPPPLPPPSSSECFRYMDSSEIIVIDYADGPRRPRHSSEVTISSKSSGYPPMISYKQHSSDHESSEKSEIRYRKSKEQSIHHHHHISSLSSHLTGNRNSHSSDTSSAYSGSDTMQSLHSSLDNEPIDLSGLHESVVDSDEEMISDSLDSFTAHDRVRDCLEKDPADRSEEDIEILLEFSQTLEAFNNMTLAVRRALCSVMVFAVVEKADTIVMNSGEELDSWSVIINGEVKILEDDQPTRIIKCGDSFGITPTMEKLYHRGVMKTCQDDCQFVCITQTDYYKILNEGESNQRRHEENGVVVLVTELNSVSSSGTTSSNGFSSPKLGHKVIRGTPKCLIEQLIDENSTFDPTYVEDFLLTHRTFLTSSALVARQLIAWFDEGEMRDRVTRVLLLWVNNHFTDFETDPSMMEFLEEFESRLESAKMNGQLRMLNFACAAKARKRIVTLSRSSREENLHFTLVGGYERGFGIFVESLDKNSKVAEIGLKRGDQIIEVNRRSFEHAMTLSKALVLLKESTHLEMTVKSNLLVFKEMLATPENSSRNRLRKIADITTLRSIGSDLSSNRLNRSADDLDISSKSTTLHPMVLSGRERMKQVLRNLMKPKHSIVDSGLTSDPCTPITLDNWEVDAPEHSLKIYKADQQSRYLLIHKNTSAREVVMLSLQEFGITECSSNFTLCEVTVDGGFVRQKRLPEAQQNLAERIGLASRYYIKNIMSSEQLIPEELAAELIKEASVNLLQLNAVEVATQLMVEDFTVFRQIEPTEHIDELFELKSKFGTPNLTRFGELVNKEMMWVITEIVSESNINRRVKVMKQFIKIAHHCYKETQNFNSMFAITSGLDHGSVKRLKASWDKISGKYIKLLSEMQSVMDPGMNFRKYRNLVSNARPPNIPVYPMVKKDLTFIHLGNKTRVEDLINFEKLRMLAKEVRSLSNMCSAPLDLFTMLERQGSDVSDAMRKLNPPTHLATMKRNRRNKEALNSKKMYEEAQMVRRVKAYLLKISIIENEDKLLQLSCDCEPPVSSSTTTTSKPPQTTTGKGRRHPSPSPSTASTASSTSHQSHTSEGRKSATTSSASTKFGTDSPMAMRKIMSLSEPSKTRRHLPPKSSISSSLLNSPIVSPSVIKKTIISRQGGVLCDELPPIQLSAESSSVVPVNTGSVLLRKKTSLDSSLKSSSDYYLNAATLTNHVSHNRVGRTLSREFIIGRNEEGDEENEKNVDDDDDDDENEEEDEDTQVSAV